MPPSTWESAAMVIILLAGLVLALEAGLQISVGFLKRPRAIWRYEALLSGQDTGMYMPDPHTLYKLRPGTYSNPDGKVTVSRGGFRDSIEPCVPPGPGGIRILILGGSTTFDLNCCDENAWPKRLEGLLAGCFPGCAVEVINGGVPGYTTAEAVAQLALRGLAYRPDIVLLHHLHNDVNARSVQDGFCGDYSHYRPDCWRRDDRHPMLRFSKIYNLARASMGEGRHHDSLYYMTVRRFNGAVYYEGKDLEQRLARVRSTTAETFERNLRTLVAIARSGGATPVLSTGPLREAVSWPALSLGVQEGNDALRRLAREESLALIDVAAAFPQDRRFFSSDSDPMHTSPQGSLVLAEQVAAGLTPIVEQRLRTGAALSGGSGEWRASDPLGPGGTETTLA